MKVKFKDITIYFPSRCCNGSLEQGDSPCQSHAQIDGAVERSHKYMREMYKRGCIVNATTITIGNKAIGRLSSKDQYKVLKRRIKRHIPYNSEEERYVYHFELQNNGQLHAHGIEYNTYRGRFTDSFYDIGKRNLAIESFNKVSNIDRYIDYINKENVYPAITNVRRKDMHGIPAISESEGGSDSDPRNE